VFHESHEIVCLAQSVWEPLLQHCVCKSLLWIPVWISWGTNVSVSTTGTKIDEVSPPLSTFRGGAMHQKRQRQSQGPSRPAQIAPKWLRIKSTSGDIYPPSSATNLG
jgi:hypothetical protein